MSLRPSFKLSHVLIGVFVLVALPVLAILQGNSVFENTRLLLWLNFLFISVTLTFAFCLFARSFLTTGAYGFLFFSCGLAIAAAGSVVGLTLRPGDQNLVLTIYNLSVWLMGFLLVCGAAYITQSNRTVESGRLVVLLGACTVSGAILSIIALVAAEGRLPPFFIPGMGGTFTRFLVLVTAVTMMFLAALLLWTSPRRARSLCKRRLIKGLFFLSGGLSLVMLVLPGSPVGWIGRALQYVGCIHLCRGAIACARETQISPLADVIAIDRRRYPNAFAVIIPILATVIRLVFLQALGTHAPFVLYFPAVVLSALYGGWRSGLAATAASAFLVAFFWLEPQFSPWVISLADWVGIGIFMFTGILVSWIVEQMHDQQARAMIAETELRIFEERKKSEVAVKASEERMKALLKSMGEGLAIYEMIYDEKGHAVDYRLTGGNPAFERILGLRLQDIKGMLASKAYGSGEPPYIEVFDRVSRTGNPEVFETYFTPMKKHFRISAFSPSKGVFATVFADITERKASDEVIGRLNTQLQQKISELERMLVERAEMEGELRKVNRTLLALSESNQAVMHAGSEKDFLEKVCRIVVESCGHSTVWIGYKINDEEKRVQPIAFSGFDKEFIAGLNVTWADTVRGRGPTGTAIRTGKTVICTDMPHDSNLLPWKEQTSRKGFLSAISIPLLVNSEVMGALSIYSRDVAPFSSDEVALLEELAADLSQGVMMLRAREKSAEAEKVLRRDKEMLEEIALVRSKELLEAHAELEKTRRLSDIGTLAATVAHELRNPLAAIGMASHNIRRKAKLEIIEKHLLTIEKKIVESNQIINNLLFYSRLRPPMFERVRVADVLAECIDGRGSSAGKKVSVKKQLSTIKEVEIDADSTQLKEIFNNILNNAFQAVPPETGEVVVQGESVDSVVKVKFQDNGHGIDQEIIDRIFDPFFTTKANGTGLGLSVCRQIVDMHHGHIEVTSQPGEGTAIIVTLPRSVKKKR